MILVLSPHLDDAVFSCGGLLASLPEGSATVVTCFTRSVENPTGFALACQRDKGLPDGVDYMQLRREEDRLALQLLGVGYRHLDLPEAPHRGYASAPELFAGILPEDTTIARSLKLSIAEILAELRPSCILYPYGAGNHADHLQVIAAVRQLDERIGDAICLRYFDQPYTLRHRSNYPELVGARTLAAEDLTAARERCTQLVLPPGRREQKMRACAAYATQVPFQFGDAAGMRELLGDTEYFWRDK